VESYKALGEKREGGREDRESGLNKLAIKSLPFFLIIKIAMSSFFKLKIMPHLKMEHQVFYASVHLSMPTLSL
jgi:hypothetical protein